MTVKILKDCLENYNPSCLIRAMNNGKKIILKTVKYHQEILTVEEMMIELDNFKEKNKQISFSLNGIQQKIIKIEQDGCYVYIITEPEEKYIITN